MSIESRSGQYGCVFGDWHISRLLGTGSGGRSAVFELCRYNNGWQEFCALKVMNLLEETGSRQQLPEFRQWEFSTAVRQQRDAAEQEVRLMEQLRGKTNIVDYLDYRFMDWQDENGYGVDLLIRMERLTDLRSQIHQGRQFPEAEIIRIGTDICRALTICHRKGILHRDIKPGNIFFNQDGDYKLGDFGVSRILDNSASAYASTSIGTMAYCAPEQMSGAYDTRVDLYSLGLVLYELRNRNRLPFAQSSYMTQKAVELRLSGMPLPLPEDDTTGAADTQLCRVILKACAFRVEDRYATAEEMLRDLERCIPGAVVYPPPQGGYPQQSTTILTPAPEYGCTPTVLPQYDHASPSAPVAEKRASRAGWLFLLVGVLAGLAVLVVLKQVPKDVPKDVHEHDFAPANCVLPRTCEDCGEIEGAAMGHDWLDASEDRPKTCTRCGATEGISLGEQKQQAYEEAMKAARALVEDRKYVKAVWALNDIYKEYGDTQSYDLMVECRRKQGSFNSSVVAAGKDNTVVISEGTIRVVGDTRYNETLGTGWDNITSVAMGDKHLMCLQKDGTVITVGDDYDKQQTGVKGLRNVVAIAAGDFHSVALLADGTLRASRGYDHCGQCSVEELMYAAGDRQIVAISAAYDHTLALLEDGRVVACGDQKATNNTPNGACNVGWWTDVVAICSGSEFSAGLRMDGTVMLSGVDWDVSGWTDIVNIAAGDYYLVGVRENGQVVAVGNSDSDTSYPGYAYLSGLKDIVYVAAGHDHTVAVDKNGKVYCVGSNSRGQCEMDGLTLSID